MQIDRFQAWLPKSVGELRHYSREKFASDLISGVTVGFVALPLAMAFAISSGVTPEAGIYCAIVAGFLISALGGSKVQIGGPTGAFVVVVSGIVAKHGLDGLFMCTFLAGIMLALMGASGLGTAVKYIPRPVVVGFTNGIATLIASTQIKDFFGIAVGKVPGEFLGRMEVLAGNASKLSLATTALSAGCLALIIGLVIFAKRVPASIVALIVGTGIAWKLGLPVETIETRFGGIPSGLPSLHIPSFRPDLITPLLPSVFAVTMLGAIESLLSAVVADRMSGDRHNPNVELIAQGIANIASPLFGGLPATGAIARTATNVRSGAKTPVSGMIHALTLLAILLIAAPLAKHAPLGVLAAILLVVSYNMGEWKEIPGIVSQSKADAAVWAITFLLTVFADLTVAVGAGMSLAALLFITRVTQTTTVVRVTEDYLSDGAVHSMHLHDLPSGVAMYRIHGPFLFGSSDKLDAVYEDWDSLPQIVALRLRNMNAIDGTGVHALEELHRKLAESGKTLIVCGAREQPLKLLHNAGFERRIGEANFTPSVAAAAERAREILSEAGKGR